MVIENSKQIEPSARLSIIVPGPPGFHSVRIHPESLPLPWVQRIEIGDPAFDGAFSVEGPMRLVCLLLDAETRRLLSRVKTERLEISDGALRAVIADGKVSDVLPLLLDMGRRCAEVVIDRGGFHRIEQRQHFERFILHDRYFVRLNLPVNR